MCIKTPNKSMAEMVELVNQALGTNVPYKKFVNIKNAFMTDKVITYGQVLEAFKKHPALSKNEVLRLFKKEALVGPETSIDGQQIFRTHLTTLVEALEDWTGKEMCNYNNHQGPLADYDGKGVTIEDIAIFFATGEGKIAEIKEQNNKAED